MAKVELIMPKMGESIMEATILNWIKKEGESVEADEAVVEIATDKVDSEIPSPVSGTIEKILFQSDDVVEVGTPIAIINTNSEEKIPATTPAEPIDKTEKGAMAPAEEKSVMELSDEKILLPYEPTEESPLIPARSGERFYSPLVRNIAKTEGISLNELESIPGSGAQGRVTKNDILDYVENQKSQVKTPSNTVDSSEEDQKQPAVSVSENSTRQSPPLTFNFQSGENEIIEMDRMRRLIADHMVKSKHTSPHVTSFVEADVTNLVNWRNNHKRKFAEQYGEKITFTPIFIEAVVSAIKDFPMINISVDGNNIILKKDINIGMAAALPSGNLIVPVIKNADHLNLAGLTKKVNDLAARARENKLKPDEISGGTFTITNVGTFGNVMGTPIINQPQVAILATGAIKKKPAVIETPEGDLIGIRSMMFLSLSYDHRVVDGSLGGSFLRRIADNLENFNPERKI